MPKKKTTPKRKAATPKATQPCSTCDRGSMPSTTEKRVTAPAPKAPAKKAPKRKKREPKIDYRKGPVKYAGAKAKSYKRQPTILG